MNKSKKLLTLQDLTEFCLKHQVGHFSAQETGYQLAVQIPAEFEKTESEDNTILFGNVRLYHIGRNRNGSSVTMDAAKKSLSTIKYKPLLADFCEYDGVRDFTSHTIDYDSDGNPIYIERQVGCFTADEPYIQHVDEYDKDYVFAKVAIPRSYTDAADIIERKNGTKVSVELLINEMQFNSEENLLELTDVIVQGGTCLGINPNNGAEIGEGMIGSRLDIDDIQNFSQSNNSLFSSTSEETNTKLIETLERLNNTLSNFNINTDEPTAQEGGQGTLKLEELCEQYNVAKEDIDFDYESLSDEELEATFKEKYGEIDKPEEELQEEPEQGEDPVEEPQEDSQPIKEDEACGGGKKKKKMSVSVDDKTFSLDISLDEKISALWNLTNDTYSEADNAYYAVSVYDDYIVMQDWWSGVIYKQSYKEEENIFSLTGDRVRVYANYLTAEEETAIKELRSNYSAIETELNQYKEAEINAQKAEIMADEAYAEFANEEVFKSIDASKYSVSDLRKECDLALASCYKAKKTFAVEKTEKKAKVSFSYIKEDEDKPYGNLFDFLNK